MGYEKWPGGHIHRQKDGRPLYVIARTISTKRDDGSKTTRRFHISTRTHNITSALKQLERFEADPWGYSPAGVEQPDALKLTDDLIIEHRRHSIEAKKNTWHHANVIAHRLTEWQDDLAGFDLRKLTLREHIKPAVDARPTNRKHRIIAIKSFFAWLRRERGLLTHSQDPTLDLAVPQAVPEMAFRKKAVDEKHVRAAWRKLKGRYRDMLEVLSETGMHVSELERFIRDETSQLVKQGSARATLITLHKSGVPTRLPLQGGAVIAAAERLRRGRTVPRWFRLHLYAACDAAKVPRFSPGVLRHSVATYAVKMGATPDQVAAMLHHKDRRTTQKFYIDVAAPVLAVPVMKMRR